MLQHQIRLVVPQRAPERAAKLIALQSRRQARLEQRAEKPQPPRAA